MGVDSRMRSDVVQVSPKKESKSDPVDREKTCPMLLRVFHSKGTFQKEELLSRRTFLKIKNAFQFLFCLFDISGRHNRPDDFTRNQTPDNELQGTFIRRSFFDKPKYSSLHLDGRNAEGDHESRPRSQSRNAQERNGIPFRNRLSGKLRKCSIL